MWVALPCVLPRATWPGRGNCEGKAPKSQDCGTFRVRARSLKAAAGSQTWSEIAVVEIMTMVSIMEHQTICHALRYGLSVNQHI